MMKRTLLAALAVAVTGLFGAAPADAQDFPGYRFDLGINGGFAWYSDILDDTHLGDAQNDNDVKFESGWILGANATYWATPMFGIRANGTYSERPLVLGSFDELDANDEDNDLMEDVNLWSASGDLMFRPMAEGLRFGRLASMPFLALGVGVKSINIAGEEPVTADKGGRFFNAGGQRWALVEDKQLMGLAAIGTDFRLADNFALRLELGDRFWDGPVWSEADIAAGNEEDTGNVVHELYLTLGTQFLLGLEAPEVVAVAPAPPAPRPQPEPEPVEERIRVCVVDPSVEGGLTTVDAIYLPETRDTVVVRNGTRRAFSTVVPRVTVANEADWFVRGEPLTMTLADDATIEYTTWQSARMIDADQLTLVGTSRGLPVYASVDDVRDFRTDWDAARRAAGTDDLDAIVAQNAALAAELEDVEFLYVPLRPTGCVFQTVRVVEQVQKK